MPSLQPYSRSPPLNNVRLCPWSRHTLALPRVLPGAVGQALDLVGEAAIGEREALVAGVPE